MVWDQDHIPNPQMPPSTDYRWEADGDHLVPVTTRDPPAPGTNTQLIKCVCKKSQCMSHCSCRSQHLWKSRRHPKVVLTDLDYADDISLLSDNMQQAQELLTRVEAECAKVGLRLNAKKTEVITYNIPSEHPPLTMTGGTALKEVKDFKYLGAWVNSTEQDLKVRKALAWRALNGMNSVWNSNLPRQIKLSFFYATVESVLLYSSECWTLKPTLEKSL